ncbi:hypothetical protein_gp009 [Bacillus phage vB_BceM_WH1]|nr:hypothetical protein_gp009 [Bacillus phage vB_BceM_WH1]
MRKRLTKDEAVLIKLMLMGGETYSTIEKKMDITGASISDIVHGRSHKDIFVPGFVEEMRVRLKNPNHSSKMKK